MRSKKIKKYFSFFYKSTLFDREQYYNEFIRKINYKFEKDPQGLKFRQNIINSNASYGWNDIFEVYISRKDTIMNLSERRKRVWKK